MTPVLTPAVLGVLGKDANATLTQIMSYLPQHYFGYIFVAVFFGTYGWVVRRQDSNALGIWLRQQGLEGTELARAQAACKSEGISSLAALLDLGEKDLVDISPQTCVRCCSVP